MMMSTTRSQSQTRRSQNSSRIERTSSQGPSIAAGAGADGRRTLVLVRRWELLMLDVGPALHILPRDENRIRRRRRRRDSNSIR